MNETTDMLIKLKLSLLHLVLTTVWILVVAVATVQSLDCYSCVTSNGPDCLSSQVTCAPGYVCNNIVYRRGYNLGMLYTKGCEDELQCIRLANLNSGVYCDHAPSQCQHCCSQDLCNAATTPGGHSGSRLLHGLYVTSCCLLAALLVLK